MKSFKRESKFYLINHLHPAWSLLTRLNPIRFSINWFDLGNFGTTGKGFLTIMNDNPF